MLWGGIIAYAVGVLALTLVEVREARGWQVMLKPLLAVGFVGTILLTGGATSGLYGHLVLLALLACAVGDVLLLRKGTGAAFLAGMGAFGLGHLIFAFAFAIVWEGSTSAIPGLLAVALIVLPAMIAWRLARRSQTEIMAVAAALYGIAIGGMLALAAASGTWLILPALAFAVSDLFVAQNRFGAPRSWHPVAITPLYFGAQLAFALSPLLLSA